MKTLIKTSFILTLFVGIFNLGLSGAYAKRARICNLKLLSQRQFKEVSLKNNTNIVSNTNLFGLNKSNELDLVAYDILAFCPSGTYPAGYAITFDADGNVTGVYVDCEPLLVLKGILIRNNYRSIFNNFGLLTFNSFLNI
jgi:hypothetical protein